MEGEGEGNRGAHRAGGKAALFIFSSLLHLPSHSEPASLTHLHLFTTKPKLSLLFLFHTFLHTLSSPCPPPPPLVHHLSHSTVPPSCLSQTI